MKKILFLIIAIVSINNYLIGQDEVVCLPDTSIIDSTGAIFPRPFIPDDSLNIGIQKVACLNTPFEFLFTVVIPTSAEINGLSLALNGARMDTMGAILNLPEGLIYSCNPSDCEFESGQPGCIIITGIPSENIDTGTYDLVINFDLLTPIGSLGETFPSDRFPGNYFLEVLPEGSEACEETLSQGFTNHSLLELYNAPNPFTDATTLFANLTDAEEMTVTINDLTGKLLSQYPIKLNSGLNEIPFPNLDLAPGIYTYSLSNRHIKLTRKMMVIK